MRSIWLSLLFTLTLPTAAACAQAAAQSADEPPTHDGRPAFATRGRETMPQMLIDEGALSVERFQTLKMPIKHWVAMEACLVLHNFPTDSIGDPPDILVIPAVRTFRMHDLTLDSLLYATDSTFMGEHWSDPTVGYALMRSNLIVVTSEYRHNKYTLRHEALHFMLWRQAHLMGHPVEYFNPCDRDYDE